MSRKRSLALAAKGQNDLEKTTTLLLFINRWTKVIHFLDAILVGEDFFADPWNYTTSRQNGEILRIKGIPIGDAHEGCMSCVEIIDHFPFLNVFM